MDKIKKYESMLCPVCKNVYFSNISKDNYEEDLKRYNDGEVQCPSCGWIYDLEQVNHPNTYLGYNGITLKEYKKRYEEKIKDNSEYNYFEENMSDFNPHICPICGKYEFAYENSFDLCPYCGWKDDDAQEKDPNFNDGENELTLNEYKMQYCKKIKENPNYVWGNDYNGIFKPMLCPICEKMYFSSPNKDNYDEEIKEYLNGEVICHHCGWIYELEQLRNPDTYIGYNKKTLNEYKKWYKEKIEENPDYDYLDENKPDPIPHICPICGKHKFKTHGYCEICPSCGWEDDEYQEENPDDSTFGINKLSLNEYKKRYIETINKFPNYFWIRDTDKYYDKNFNDNLRSTYNNKSCFEYGNNLGLFKEGVPTKHIMYLCASEFDENKLESQFNKYGKEFNCSNKEEYVEKAIEFANDVDIDKYRSFVDYRWITYKFEPKSKILVLVTKDGIIISFKHYRNKFLYEVKKGEKRWIK